MPDIQTGPPIVAALVCQESEPSPAPLNIGALQNLPVLAGDAWWGNWEWNQAFEVTCGTLIDVPPSVQVAFALAKDRLVQQCLEGGDQAELAWRKLSMFDQLVLNNRRPEGESQTESVVRRLQQATDGDWNNLWLEVTAPSPLRAWDDKKLLTDQVALIKDLVNADETGRALKTLRPKTPPMRDPS